ncbi:efflux RND transporter periplasmic adaptor subunit [Pseudomonas sp. NPDC090202]|uniref:efflux RND transporter periplasmic adaptor subunit n=1 Tax=unclassified Pseudomonas TaxID=196821 RepID=UPI00382D5128
MHTDATPSLTPRRRNGRARFGLLLALIVLIAVVFFGITGRASESKALQTWTEKQALPSVLLVKPLAAAQGATVILPGRLEAWSRAAIFARVGGYLKSWKADIGTRVKAGQLLAEIDTPELDQQLLQARADLATAKANAGLASTSAKRWQAMLASDSVSKQEVDERNGDLAAKQAQMMAAQANVERLVATKGFQRLTAPFDGVVTARSTDVGALINAGSTGGGQELFAVSDVSHLRVYVQVPQAYAAQIKVGSSAKISVPEYPKEPFTATVIASADAVAAASGTTLVQLQVDNQAGRLLPGAYTSVRFDLPLQADIVRLPATALLFDDHGMRVATLDGQDHVHFKTVTIARDFGDVVEIGSGLTSSDRIIDTPPDGLNDNDAVQVSSGAAVVAEGKPHG